MLFIAFWVNESFIAVTYSNLLMFAHFFVVELQDLVGEEFRPPPHLSRAGVLAVKHYGLAAPGDQLKCVWSVGRKTFHTFFMNLHSGNGCILLSTPSSSNNLIYLTHILIKLLVFYAI